MVAEADEKLMEKFFEAGTLTDDELVAGLRAATIAGKLFPLVCTSATLNIGVPQLLDAIVATLPSPADRPFNGVDKDGARVPRAADEKAPAVGVRLEDHCRSVCRPDHDVPRRVGVAQVRFDRPQQDAGCAGAARQPAAAAGQDADRRAGDQGRRPRRRREAEGHADQRHARRQGRRA